MDDFIVYLEKSKKLSNTIDSSKSSQTHVIIGNESCDLDSMISAFALGYFYYQQSQFAAVPIPLLNIPSDEFCLRTENQYLLKKLGIDQNLLVFRNDLNLKEIKNCSLFVSLVDHHILRPEDDFLAVSVTEIFDHRPIDPNATWDKNKVNILIDDVGSCSTLIAHKILSTTDQHFSNILASLIYHVIIFDTIAFSPDAGKAKELDVTIAKKLAKLFDIDEDVTTLFDELWTAHNDVSHLTPRQLLSKDLKIVDGMPVPGLPMLIEEYLKFSNVLQEMIMFCKQKHSSMMVLIGLHVIETEGSKQVFRDIAVFNYDNNQGLVDIIIRNLQRSLELKGYDFCLQEVSVDIPHVKYFKQNNIKLTRKHILPIIKDAIVQCKHDINKK